MTRTVTGSAMYRERIALPPGAAMEVLLEDVSRADAPAEVIASQRSEPVSPPFRFALEVDPARIDPAHAYAVRVRVVVDGELWFLSDTSNPVLTRGAGDAVEIRLRMVRGQASVTPGPAAPAPEPAPGTPGTSTATLEGTYWKLTHLGEAPVAVPSGGREPHLILHAEDPG
ncbi:MAG: YbaY family lipoprotein [Chloroflexota bacterium]